MTAAGGWVLVLAASGVCFATKLAGHLVPRAVVDRPAVVRLAGLVTVALLTALVAVQTLATGSGGLAVDARAAALAVAALALALRAPFLLVVVLGAATAAGLRALGAP